MDRRQHSYRRVQIAALLALALVCLADRARAQVELAEVGGDLAANNLAQEVGAVAFALDELDFGVHFIPNLNDGVYGNTNSWIGGGASPPFVGISLAGSRTVASIAFGRDNGGEEQVFTDRTAGVYTLEYTTVASPDATTTEWTAIGELSYDCAFPDGTPWLRHRYNFDAVEATGIRLLVPATGVAGGTAIDEIELYATPGELLVETLPRLELISRGGPATTPAASEDVPSLEEGNLARAADAVPFGTPPHPAPAHEIAHLNDGLYGNAQSWLGNEPGPSSGVVYAGIYFSDTPREIAQLAFGRDNTGLAADRIAGTYRVEITSDTFDPGDDAATAAAAWITLGLAMDCTEPRAQRRRYAFDPVTVRALRIVTALGNVIDEIEVGLEIGSPPPPSLPLVSTGGPVTTPAATTDVPTLEDGNLARAGDAVAFGTPPHPAPVHEIAHLNDGLYGNDQSWLANEPGPVSGDVYAGIYFVDGPRVLEAIALGRDNTNAFLDRTVGAYVVEITSEAFDASDDTAIDAAGWLTLGLADAHLDDGSAALRHVYCLGSVSARAVRVRTVLGNVLDEVELYGPQPTGEPLALTEIGGGFADGNLATAKGATAFALDELDFGVHYIPNLNDGIYGNTNSWIGNVATPGFAGVAFGASVTVASVAWGRDNGGEETEFIDRTPGTYVLQYTDVESPGADTPACDWITIGHVDYGDFCPELPWLRHRFQFDPVNATAIRLLVPAVGIGGGTAIDELEAYSAPGEILVDPCVPPTPLELVETGGPVTTPASPGDVPALVDRNLALLPDAVAFGTPPHPAPVHEIAHLNDGLYGNSQSWLGNEPGPSSGEVYAGIYFADGPRTIDGIALGRDNTGQFTDRLAGGYLVEVTSDEFDPADDAATSAASWTLLGVASGHLGDAMPQLRRRYALDPIAVRAVRVITAIGNVIDELELFGDAPDPEPLFIRGDSNSDGRVDISDASFTLSWLFLGGRGPLCPDAADVLDQGSIDITSAIRTLNFLFLGGPAPAAPFPDCGVDPTEDALDECLYPQEICR